MHETLRHRRLGTTGISLTELALGTWGLASESYGRIFPEQRLRTIVRAYEQGIRVFDMAPFWGEDGLSERAVAEAISDKREDTIYVTRAGLSPTEHGLEPSLDAKALRESCEASLKRLQTDHIDVWLLQGLKEGDLQSDALRDLTAELTQAGKVRAWGVTTQDAHLAREAMDADANVLCLPFNLLRPQLVWDLSAEAQARGVGLIARSVLMHGMLAGRWHHKKRFTPDDHRSQRWTPDSLGARLKQAQEFRFLVHGPALSMASAAQRFALADPAVTCAVIGPRTPGQVEASVHAISEVPLMPDEDVERVRGMPHRP